MYISTTSYKSRQGLNERICFHCMNYLWIHSTNLQTGKYNGIFFHFFSVLFDQEGSKHIQSNIGLVCVLNLSVGRSAILCSPTLPHRYLHATHFEINDQTTEFTLTIQNPDDLILFKVYPIPPCPTD